MSICSSSCSDMARYISWISKAFSYVPPEYIDHYHGSVNGFIDEECDIRIDLFTYLRCIHEELCQDSEDFNSGKLPEYIAFALYHTVDKKVQLSPFIFFQLYNLNKVDSTLYITMTYWSQEIYSLMSIEEYCTRIEEAGSHSFKEKILECVLISGGGLNEFITLLDSLPDKTLDVYSVTLCSEYIIYCILLERPQWTCDSYIRYVYRLFTETQNRQINMFEDFISLYTCVDSGGGLNMYSLAHFIDFCLHKLKLENCVECCKNVCCSYISNNGTRCKNRPLHSIYTTKDEKLTIGIKSLPKSGTLFTRCHSSRRFVCAYHETNKEYCEHLCKGHNVKIHGNGGNATMNYIICGEYQQWKYKPLKDGQRNIETNNGEKLVRVSYNPTTNKTCHIKKR